MVRRSRFLLASHLSLLLFACKQPSGADEASKVQADRNLPEAEPEKQPSEQGEQKKKAEAEDHAKKKSPRFEKDLLRETYGFGPDTKKSVPLEEFHQGCPERDCIPSIDDPTFTPAERYGTFLSDQDIVFSVRHGGITRAYPRKILSSHEVVNDTFGETPVVVTYCPLCASSLAFISKVGDEATQFGVSGVLHNSDLVLYDRKSNSLWGQVTGTAVVGERTGEKLKQVPIEQHRFGSFKKEYPKAAVLNPASGEGQDERYDESHYDRYAKSDRLFMPVKLRDARLHVKEEVIGIELGKQSIAFTLPYLDALGKKKFEEKLGERTIVFEWSEKQQLSATDKDSGEAFVPTRLYWFAWYSFHPQTQLRSHKGSEKKKKPAE